MSTTPPGANQAHFLVQVGVSLIVLFAYEKTNLLGTPMSFSLPRWLQTPRFKSSSYFSLLRTQDKRRASQHPAYSLHSIKQIAVLGYTAGFVSLVHFNMGNPTLPVSQTSLSSTHSFFLNSLSVWCLSFSLFWIFLDINK
jgi:hypothetical protein